LIVPFSIASADDDADKRAQHQRALLHNAPKASPRQPSPGEEVWRVRDRDTGRVQICELRDNSRAGAGWEVQILEAGEILVSRRCEPEPEARYVAEAARIRSEQVRLRSGVMGASALFSGRRTSDGRTADRQTSAASSPCCRRL
jgi:hypothetical protein